LIIKELKNITASIKGFKMLGAAIAKLPSILRGYWVLLLSLFLGFFVNINAQNNPQNQLDLARYLLANNDPKKAYTIAKDAATFYRNNVALHAEALTVQGNALRHLTEYDKAESLLKEVVIIRKKHFGERSLETSNALQNLANVFLDRDMPNHAMPLLHETENIRQKLFPPQHEDIAKVHEALGTCYTQRQDYTRAIDYYLKAAQHPAYQTSDMYLNISNGYLDLGDPAQAHTFLRKAMSFSFQNNFNHTVEEGELLTNLAHCQRRLGNSQSAIGCLEKAIVIYSQLGKYDKELANSYLNLGVILRDDGLYRAAIDYFQKAMNQHRNDPSFNANAYLQIGLAHSENNDLVEAQQSLGKSIQILRGLAQQSNLDVLIELYLTKAKIEIKQSDFKRAKQALNQADEMLTKLPKTNQASHLHLHYLSIYAGLHKAELGKKNVSTASVSNVLATYDNAISFLESVMTRLTERESIWFWQKQYGFLFDDAIELCLTQKQPVFIEKALQYTEKSKNIWLRYIQHFRTNKSQIPLEVQQQLSDLSIEIAFLEKEYFLEKNKLPSNFQTPKLSNLDKSLFDLKKRFTDLNKQYVLTHTDKSKKDTFSLTHTQAQLAADEVVLLYHVSDKKIHLFILTKQDIHTHTILKKDNWLTDIRRFYELISAPWQKPDQLESLCQLSLDFYKTLVQPASPFFKNKKQLTIIPDEELALIPFEVFHTEGVKDKSVMWRYPYLLNKMPIQYRYQLSENTLPKSFNNTAKALIFAPDFNQNTLGLRPLYYNTVEGKNILSKVGGTFLDKKNASESNFQSFIAQYSIIHLATHGVTDMENPMLSRVAFTEQPDSVENEMLYVEEIYVMQMNNDLLVLSACQTNIGQLLQGEGVLSVARAFKTAGVKSIITSLWSIDDQTTSYLMVKFYDNLKQGMDKASALQKAKLDFVKEHPSEAHPFYWAALISIGENDALFKPNTAFNWWIPLSIFSVFIVGFIIWKILSVKKL
jgi:CHAT domain-containing protein/tetratricopeptide (TPR) repeat protein